MSEQTADYFSMLGVPRQFDVDEASLTRAYRELQRSVHPDRFAGAATESDVWRCKNPRRSMKPTKHCAR